MDNAVAFLNRYLDLVEQGVDWLARAAQRWRQRRISPWASVRMNDAHGANNWDQCYFNSPPQRNPRLRLSGKRINPSKPTGRYMTVCSYEHREVRDFYCTMIQELMEDYDLDGLELDWLRCPVCCDPPASQKTVDMIVDWHASIRPLVDAA